MVAQLSDMLVLGEKIHYLCGERAVLTLTLVAVFKGI